jgi:hypothetical protein
MEESLGGPFLFLYYLPLPLYVFCSFWEATWNSEPFLSLPASLFSAGVYLGWVLGLGTHVEVHLVVVVTFGGWDCCDSISTMLFSSSSGGWDRCWYSLCLRCLEVCVSRCICSSAVTCVLVHCWKLEEVQDISGASLPSA